MAWYRSHILYLIYVWKKVWFFKSQFLVKKFFFLISDWSLFSGWIFWFIVVLVLYSFDPVFPRLLQCVWSSTICFGSRQSTRRPVSLSPLQSCSSQTEPVDVVGLRSKDWQTALTFSLQRTNSAAAVPADGSVSSLQAVKRSHFTRLITASSDTQHIIPLIWLHTVSCWIYWGFDSGGCCPETHIYHLITVRPLCSVVHGVPRVFMGFVVCFLIFPTDQSGLRIAQNPSPLSVFISSFLSHLILTFISSAHFSLLYWCEE